MERATLKEIGIKALSRDEISAALKEMGQPAFRSRQIVQWLYAKAARSYDEMTNLPASLRSRLTEEMPLHFPSIEDKRVSSDGTRKYLLRLSDGAFVETVGLPNNHRLTVCFSTQAGCGMACSFCATGQSGLARSLAPGEIADQINVVAEDFGERVTNAVAMGQGEPFSNYDSTLEALRVMNSEDGMNIGARHLTVSTCGLLPMIRRFASEPEQFTLAISLHSAVQKTRDRLMPSMKRYTLDRLRDSLISYSSSTGRRPSLEYSLIAGENDSDDELEALISFASGMLCHVNLLIWNKVQGSSYRPSKWERAEEFAAALGRKGIDVSIRRPRGSDIAGACGQLKQPRK